MMQYIELTEERVSSHGKADGFEPKRCTRKLRKLDHQDMSNYLSRYYMNAYNQGKEDSEGLKADELREILLTVKGIGPAKAENIMEAVGKALAEKG